MACGPDPLPDWVVCARIACHSMAIDLARRSVTTMSFLCQASVAPLRGNRFIIGMLRRLCLRTVA